MERAWIAQRGRSTSWLYIYREWPKGQYTRGVLLPEYVPGSFCTCQYTRGSVVKFAQFAQGACSPIVNRLNIVEHFAGWKFCSRGWSIPMKSLVHTEKLCSQSVPLEHTPGAKSLVCIGLNKCPGRLFNFRHVGSIWGDVFVDGKVYRINEEV